MNDYQDRALRTKGDEFHGKLVSAWMVVQVLTETVDQLRKLDALRRALFHGEALPPGLAADLAFRFGAFLGPDADPAAPIMAVRLRDLDHDVLRGILGLLTGAGELGGDLLRELDSEGSMDPELLAEGAGEAMWCLAVLLFGIGYSFDEAQGMNIAKLEKRYPTRVTASIGKP